MPIKVFFMGNPLLGDDGIGPHLYSELKEEKRLGNIELHDAGSAGLNLISLIDDGDRIIIVDAIISKESKEDIGNVMAIDEKDICHEIPAVSAHDIGLGQTIRLIREYAKEIPPIKIIGITAKHIGNSPKLSREIKKNMEKIKEDVVRKILEASAD